MDTRTHTIAEFVAGYFSNEAVSVDYSELWPPPSWSDYVGMIADAGSLLEDVVQEALSRGERIAEWYEILDEAAIALQTAFLQDKYAHSADPALRETFGAIVARHLEVA